MACVNVCQVEKPHLAQNASIISIIARVSKKKLVPNMGWLWMSMFELADLRGICSYQTCLWVAPVLASLHWAGPNELIWLSSVSAPTAVCIHHCLPLSTQCCKQRLYLFQTTFSRRQVSKSGQAGEREPCGCQWSSSHHQHCNQL